MLGPKNKLKVISRSLTPERTKGGAVISNWRKLGGPSQLWQARPQFLYKLSAAHPTGPSPNIFKNYKPGLRQTLWKTGPDHWQPNLSLSHLPTNPSGGHRDLRDKILWTDESEQELYGRRGPSYIWCKGGNCSRADAVGLRDRMTSWRGRCLLRKGSRHANNDGSTYQRPDLFLFRVARC